MTNHCEPNQTIHSIMSALPDETLSWIEDQLSNNDDSSDDELLEHFVSNGLSETLAAYALTFRSHYLSHMYLAGCTPLRGASSQRFEPHSGRFVLDALSADAG